MLEKLTKLYHCKAYSIIIKKCLPLDWTVEKNFFKRKCDDDVVNTCKMFTIKKCCYVQQNVSYHDDNNGNAVDGDGANINLDGVRLRNVNKR